MPMMGVTFFLRLQIKQKGGTSISQSKYYKKVLKKFGMDIAKEASTSMATPCYLEKDESGTEVSKIRFRGMI